MTEETELQEKRFYGIGVSPGVARGKVAVRITEEEDIPEYTITPEEVPDEVHRFEVALLTTRAQITEMQQTIAQSIGARDAGIFDAHLLVVEDQTLIDEVLRNLQRDHKNVEFIFQNVANRYTNTLSQIDDPYLRERSLDIQDVSRRILRNLLGKSPRVLAVEAQPHILVAHNITPSDTAIMNRDLVLGFATDIGSRTSHTAIMANSLEIPAVVALHNITEVLKNGDSVLLDGYSGLLIINPTERTLWEYGQIESRREAVDRQLTELRNTSPTTSDGYHIILSANIEVPNDMDAVHSVGAEGVGLYRTEFSYLNHPTLPSEEEQFSDYHTVATSAAPHEVTIRTLDVGGDKLVDSVQSGSETNPFLGWRAIRFCLEHPEIFKAHLRAILRASANKNVKLMFPMISGMEELRMAKTILEECREELRSQSITFDENMEIGMMIEVPSASVISDLLAQEVDFFSIGTNDLIQYSIAVDRLNERTSNLYQPTHPAILRLIKWTVNNAHAAGKWVGLCGEMASDILLTPLLIGLEIDEFSVTPTALPRVKYAIQSLDRSECMEFIKEAWTLDTCEAIEKRCREIGRGCYPELFE